LKDFTQKQEMGFRGLVKRVPVWGKVVIVLLLVFIAGIIGTNIYLTNMVNGRLRQMVATASHGMYKLDYSKVSVNALTGSLSLHDVELMPDTNAFAQLRKYKAGPRYLWSGKTKKLAFRNVHWLAYLNSKTVNIGKLLMDRPQFNVTQYHQQQDTAEQAGMYEQLLKQVKELRIRSFDINDAEVVYQIVDTAKQQATVNRIEHLNLGFSGVHFEKKADKPRLIADDYRLQLKQYRHLTEDSLYWIGITGFDYNSKHQLLKLATFYVEPRFADKELSKKLTEQQTIYKMKFDNITAQGFDMNILADEGRAMVPELSIGKGDVDIYMDRALPRPGADQVNVAISQKLLHLGAPFMIRSMKLGNINLKYREYETLTDRTAVIAFENMTGLGVNITNIAQHIKQNPLMKVSLKGSFLKSGVDARFEFDLSSADGRFTTWIRADQLDAFQLNPILAPVAKIEARKGTLRQLEATVQGNDKQATANVDLQYEGLKINLLKLEGDSLKRKGLPSIFANILIEDDNPKDGILRKANGISIRRGFGRSFFNMLWLSVSTGIQQIIAKKKGLKF
jgi:hypothetical protein